MNTIASIKSQSPIFGNLSREVSNDYDSINGSILKGIDVSLFSYQVSLDNYENKIKEVCGTHFEYRISSISDEGAMTVFISPKEFCLVDGGMMYKSAGSIIADFIEKGFLIKDMRAIEG